MIKLVWLILFVSLAAAVSANPPFMALPKCPSKCGNVDIPYPFGIGPGCFYNASFEVTCNTTTSLNTRTPFLRQFKLQILSVNLRPDSWKKDSLRNSFTINAPIGATNSRCPQAGVANFTSISFEGSPFTFSSDFNAFMAVGCDNAVLAYQGAIVAGCTPECIETNFTSSSSRCYGLDCCQNSIFVSDMDSYGITISGDSRRCTKAFLSVSDWYTRNLSNAINKTDHAPVAINFDLSRTYTASVDAKYPVYECSTPNAQCTCGWAYEGNPYIPNGCRLAQACAKCDKHECSKRPGGELYCKRAHKTEIILGSSLGGGLLIILVSAFCFWLHKVMKKKKSIKLKKKFFKRNGGLILEQQISSHETKAEKTMIFSSEVLQKATDNFNANRILGEGGQGTVYKGMFTDGRIVAIKKAKVIDESQLEVFINEVVILSQLNHRNIVKLLGCCLETEVPLLVYEFISNGNLFELIHDPDEEFPFSWKMRLQIATEVAGALAYLHSASSVPIYHRDIKSTNILLDEKLRAKIADFGTSRFVAIEQTHLTTVVQGTFGYLDPEYFQSSQFTDKSDVYSYGVVLVELLTGQKAISSITSEQDERSLATRFIVCIKEMRLFDILDHRVKEEAAQEDIIAIANIAKRCVNLSGKKRPTMTEVMRELEGIRMSHLPKPPSDATTQNRFDDEHSVEMSGSIDTTFSSIHRGVARRGFSSTI